MRKLEIHPATVTASSGRNPKLVRLAKPDQTEKENISLKARLLDPKTLLGFLLSAILIIYFVLTLHIDFGAIWANLRTANVWLLSLAFVVYYGVFYIRGLRWQLVLNKAGFDTQEGVKLPALPSLLKMIYLSWFVNCLVPAKLGDVYRSWLLRKQSGASVSRGLGTAIGERLADIIMLFVLLCVSGLLVLGQLGDKMGNLGLLFELGFGLVFLVAIGLVGLRLGGKKLEKYIPQRLRNVCGYFRAGLMTTLRRDIAFKLYGLTALIWFGEGLRLYLVIASLHIVGLSLPIIIFTALASSLLSTIPFTPAGLGAVEGTVIAILTSFGIERNLAGAVILLDRLISYWSNILGGALLYLFEHYRKPKQPRAMSHEQRS